MAGIGAQADTLVLKLYPANSPAVDVMIAQSWDWTESVLEQPSKFSIRLGSSQTASQILAAYPKGTKCQLFIADALQCTGRIDGREAEGDANGTMVTLHGRDNLAKVNDVYVDAVQTFKDTTYTALVWHVLLYLNLVTGTKPDPTQLAATNDANRQVKAGKFKKIQVIAPPRTVDQILFDSENGTSTTAVASHEIQANVGERWLSFLRRYLDPAGLTLWAAADGTFVLSQPNAAQAPVYEIVKRKVGSSETGNVEWFHLVDDATHRHTVATTYGKSGGRAKGRFTAVGSATDDDLYNHPNDPWYRTGVDPNKIVPYAITFREANCAVVAQCENHSYRKLSEERREGWQLHYRVAGLTLAGYSGGGEVPINVDTVVFVNDEELDIYGEFYIESVQRQRGPQTQTTIRLCRRNDIVLDQPAAVVEVEPQTVAADGFEL